MNQDNLPEKDQGKKCECPDCSELATTCGDDGGSLLCAACSEYAVDDDGVCWCSEHQPAEYARLTED